VEETAKKTKAPAKPRKTAAKKAATPKNVTEIPSPAPVAEFAAPANGALPSNVIQMKPSHDQVALLAHKFWAERGYQHGHHVEDWFRAEQELRGMAS